MRLVTQPLLKAHGLDEVRIRGIRMEALIGFSRHEEGILQPLDVDLILQRDAPESYSDDPANVFDYRVLKDELRKRFLGARYRLLEAFAQAVAVEVLERDEVRLATVTVHKPGALTGAEDVAVRLTRSRR